MMSLTLWANFSLLNTAAQKDNLGQLRQMPVCFADLADMEASSLLNLVSLQWNKFSEIINKVIFKNVPAISMSSDYSSHSNYR